MQFAFHRGRSENDGPGRPATGITFSALFSALFGQCKTRRPLSATSFMQLREFSAAKFVL